MERKSSTHGCCCSEKLSHVLLRLGTWVLLPQMERDGSRQPAFFFVFGNVCLFTLFQCLKCKILSV